MEEGFQEAAGRVPLFNDYLLREFTREQINSLPDRVDTLFTEATKYLGGAVTYHHYTILGPEDRVNFMLKHTRNITRTQTKASQVTLASSRWHLARFEFRWKGQVYYTHLYIPYVYQDMLLIRDRRRGIQRSVTEQVFSQRADGVEIRPIQMRVPFIRKEIYTAVCVVTGFTFREFVTMAHLHRKKRASKKLPQTSCLLYLMFRYGFPNTMAKFGLTANDIGFCEQPDPAREDLVFFQAQDMRGKNVKCEMYLWVRRALFDDNRLVTKIVADILFTMSRVNVGNTLADLYDPYGSAWQKIVGRLISEPSIQLTKAAIDASAHLESVDRLLDHMTRARFANFEVYVENIYDVLVYVFTNIDRILISLSGQDLYRKRIDVVDDILIRGFSEPIFRQFYRAGQKTNLVEKDIVSMLRFAPDLFERSLSKSHTQSTVVDNVSIHGDNWLLAIGLTKRRGDTTTKAPFHPSIPVVESIVALGGNMPGVTGQINPHLRIKPSGGIERPPEAVEIEKIARYL